METTLTKTEEMSSTTSTMSTTVETKVEETSTSVRNRRCFVRSWYLYHVHADRFTGLESNEVDVEIGRDEKENASCRRHDNAWSVQYRRCLHDHPKFQPC